MKSVLVALFDRTQCRLLYKNALNEPLKEISTMINPEGSLLNRELAADRPGSATRETGRGHNPLDGGLEPHERALENFAGQVSDEIARVHADLGLSCFIVAAEPHALGVLRKKLGGHANLPQREDIQRDFSDLSVRDAETRIRELTELPVFV